MREAGPDSWFRVEGLQEGVSRIYEPFVDPAIRCNVWHVRGRDRDLLIDTGMGLRPLKPEIARLSEHPLIAAITHSHFDHSGGLYEFDCRLGHAREASLLARPTRAGVTAEGYVTAEIFRSLPNDSFDPLSYNVRPAPLTGYLDEGDVVDLGDRVFQVLHLPGHSPGSVGFFEDRTGLFFSGDVVFDGPLYDNLYHSDPVLFRESMRRLKDLRAVTIHPGHFRSFGRAEMLEIIDAFLAGERRAAGADQRGG